MFSEIPIYEYNTIILGSGCGAFNAADSLYDLNVKDIAIVTEGINMGTSRNTGSDKQTYYKLSLGSSAPDSVYKMAQTLFDGGAMHGDIALVEATMSARCFYKLVNKGVPFPYDQYGQYVGYKTDHDPLQRGTSCGPLTSKLMTEKLEKSIKEKNIKIYDGIRIVSILVKNNKAIGAIGICKKSTEKNLGMVIFKATNIIYALGGPSAMYYNSVYPPSQVGSHGLAFKSGVKGVNLGEWQYGIASTKFRWNLSGTYQQVIPRYVSIDENGEHEFLKDYFENASDMYTAVFLKGYQWPFDPRKLNKKSFSSFVDIAVYEETQKGRKVYLDFTKNPKDLDFSTLYPEAMEYLENSKVLFGRPIDRLLKMNKPAYDLYKNNNIDLSKEYLEIAICSQHNNGGLKINKWWQSNVENFFPVGEASGSLGVYRPGGTALNSTQVGSMRAAQYISKNKTESSWDESIAVKEVEKIFNLYNSTEKGESNVRERRKFFGKKMDAFGAFLRNEKNIEELVFQVKEEINTFPENIIIENRRDFLEALINEDILVSQYVYLCAMLDYIKNKGVSRGSYLINVGLGSKNIEIKEDKEKNLIQESILHKGEVKVEYIERNPIPEDNSWYENVYNDFIDKGE
ncbi:MAG: FAD-binding protein [Lachnospirales bacterium]